MQSLLILTLPRLYALTPAVLLLALRAIDTALVTTGLKQNPYLRGVLPRKTTAQVPDRNGDIHSAGQEKIAVLLLGAKSNHPLGIFASDFKTTGDYLSEMTNELESGVDQASSGCESPYAVKGPI